MRPDSSEEIFAVIIFADRMHDVLTPLPADAHVPYANQKKTTLNHKAMKQARATMA